MRRPLVSGDKKSKLVCVTIHTPLDALSVSQNRLHFLDWVYHECSRVISDATRCFCDKGEEFLEGRWIRLSGRIPFDADPTSKSDKMVLKRRPRLLCLKALRGG